MKKRTLLIILSLLTAALLCLSGCSQTTKTREYNVAVTGASQMVKYIGDWDIILLDTMEKTEDGLSATFRVYSVDAMQVPNDFLGLTAAEADKVAALKCIGTASATFLGGSLDNIRHLQVILNQ